MKNTIIHRVHQVIIKANEQHTHNMTLNKPWVLRLVKIILEKRKVSCIIALVSAVEGTLILHRM